jgi:hypothetical protein
MLRDSRVAAMPGRSRLMSSVAPTSNLVPPRRRPSAGRHLRGGQSRSGCCRSGAWRSSRWHQAPPAGRASTRRWPVGSRSSPPPADGARQPPLQAARSSRRDRPPSSAPRPPCPAARRRQDSTHGAPELWSPSRLAAAEAGQRRSSRQVAEHLGDELALRSAAQVRGGCAVSSSSSRTLPAQYAQRSCLPSRRTDRSAVAAMKRLPTTVPNVRPHERQVAV